MCVSMIAEFVAFICDASNEIRISLSILSDDEKCRGNTLAFQNIENGRRPSWIRTIVEGEREQARSIAGSLDYVRDVRAAFAGSHVFGRCQCVLQICLCLARLALDWV